MNTDQKTQMWRAFALVLPYLEIAKGSKIEYAGAVFFRFTKNLLHGRLFYGPMNWHIGGALPFYSITSNDPDKWRYRDPELMFDDDVPRLSYETAEELEAKTEEFWSEVESIAHKIKDMALKEVIKHANSADIRGTLRHLRMLVGATVWTTPRLREVLVRAVPTPSEATTNGYRARKRKTYSSVLLSRLKRFRLRDFLDAVIVVCRLTWQMSALGRIFAQA